VAINKLAPNKAAGPDRLHARLILHLGPKMRVHITNLFNASWNNAQVPQSWRTADIRPVLKKGKDPSKIVSHRPISLTSCLGKVLERVITNRLVYHLEANNILAPEQAGFRSSRCTEDQVIRLTQHVNDALQHRPSNRTLLTLLDLSKAYDTVWRDGLIHKLLNANVPVKIIRWIQTWLNNRLNFVTINNVQSKRTIFQQGVPQGSVISPILFLLYINDLKDRLPNNGVKLSLFADDIAAYISGNKKDDLSNKMQSTINEIHAWTLKWKLHLNPEKCNYLLFSNDSKDAKWRTDISIDNTNIAYNANPTFLGVTYDRVLSFNAHVSNVAKKVKARSNIIRKLANTEWGFDISNLRASYIALGRSCIEYAAAGWAPWTSHTTRQKLEASQRFACRAITGMVKTTPSDLLLVESHLPSINTRIQQLNTIAYEKARRLPNNNPRTIAANNNVRQRTRRSNWRTKAEDTWNNIFQPNNNREHGKFPPLRCPWENLATTNFHRAMQKKSDSAETNKSAAMAAINNLSPNHEAIAYTDGSAKDANTNGGAGIHFTKPAIINIAAPAGTFTSSFQAELMAISICLEKSIEQKFTSTLVITDSLSSYEKIQQLTKGQRPTEALENKILNFLATANDHNLRFTFLWSPSHCNVSGNDTADDLANQGSNMPQANVEWTYATAKARINRSIRQTKIHEPEHSAVYGKPDGNTNFPPIQGNSRQEQVLASRVRSNHHPETLYWRHKLGLHDTNMCRLCHFEPETATHIVSSCPAVVRPGDPGDILFNAQEIAKRWQRWISKIDSLPSL